MNQSNALSPSDRLREVPLQSLCPRGRSEHASTFATVSNLSVFCLLLCARTHLEVELH
jgi:hypothetical protein